MEWDAGFWRRRYGPRIFTAFRVPAPERPPKEQVVVVTLLHPSTERCTCGHGPWSHRLIAFRQTEGQLLSTPGICSGGECGCQTYERQSPRIMPPRRPRRIPPLGYTWKMEL